MSAGEVLAAAAERLRRLGWCKGAYGGPCGPNCVRGAITQVAGDIESGTDARAQLAVAIGIEVDHLTTWNDDPSRTLQEVVTALDRAVRSPRGTTPPAGGPK